MMANSMTFYCAGCGINHTFGLQATERLVYLMAELLVTGGSGLPMKVRGNRLETVVCLRSLLDEEYRKVEHDLMEEERWAREGANRAFVPSR